MSFVTDLVFRFWRGWKICVCASPVLRRFNC